jgi:DNA-binding NarL/FixJ family response regulator
MEKINSAIRIVLAEDHPVVRNGITQMINHAEGIELLGAATNGDEAIKMVESYNPDVLVLDIEMPGINGVDVTRILRAKYPTVKILILSGYEDKVFIRELFQLGASGYLTKDETTDTILEAIRGVASGSTGWMSRRIASQLSGMMLEDFQQPDHLTPRELQVLSLVVEGKTNQRIGVDLKISEKTVEKYLESIFRKLGVNSRVEAAVYAVREKLVSEG